MSANLVNAQAGEQPTARSACALFKIPKRPFASYAQRILDHLADPDGVFVSHTSADIRVLRGELERQSDAGTTSGLTQLPDLPILDTATLPRLLGVPGLPAHRGSVSLTDV